MSFGGGLNEKCKNSKAVMKIWNFAEGELRDYTLANLREYGEYDDRDSILESTFISPVCELIDNGWSEDEIMSLDDGEPVVAKASGLSYDEYEKAKDYYDVPFGVPFSKAEKLLALRERYVEKELEHVSFKDRFIETLPAWTERKPLKAIELALGIGMGYGCGLAWFFNAISNLTENQYEEIKSDMVTTNTVLKMSCLDFLGNTRRRELDEVFWVRICYADRVCTYPIYRVRDIQQELIGLGSEDDNIKSMVSNDMLTFYLADNDEYARGDTTAFPVITFDSLDPIKDSVQILMEKFKLNNLEAFSDEEIYSTCFMALLMAQQTESAKRDWFFYLLVPQLFRRWVRTPITTSLIGTIIAGTPNAGMDEDICYGLVDVDGELLSVYVAEASGKLREGGVIRFGSYYEQAIGYGDSLNDFVEWLRSLAGE